MRYLQLLSQQYPTVPSAGAEIIRLRNEDGSKQFQYVNIIDTVPQIGQAGQIIEDLCYVAKRLTVEQFHIVGDIFDRGPGRTSSWTAC